MAEQSIKFLIDANSDQAIGQINKAIQAVFGLGNATLTVNKDAADAYRKTQVAAEALAGATAAAAAKVRSAYEAERAALDPLYSATKRYESALQTLDGALEAQVISEAEANQVRSLAKLRYDDAARAAANYSTEAGRMATGSRNTGFMVQNAAFQLSDFAVQVGAGTSAMRAASMQLPQLLGGFGIWGAVIGGAVAVLGALIPALMRTGDEAASAGDRLGDLKGALSSYTDFAKIAGMTTEELRQQFGRFSEQVREDAKWLAQVKLGDATAALKGDAAGLASALDDITAAQKSATAAATYWADTRSKVAQGIGSDADVQNALDAFKLVQADADASAAALGLTLDQATKLREALGRLNEAKGVDEIRTAAQGGIDALKGMFEVGAAVPPEIRKIVDGLVAVRDNAQQAALAGQPMASRFDDAAGAAVVLADQVTNAMQAAFGLRDAAPGDGWLSSAINQASTLAAKMWNAVGAFGAMGAAQSVAIGGAGRPEGLSGADGNQASRNAVIQAQIAIAQKNAAAAAAAAGRAGSGGGGGGSPEKDRLTELKDAGTEALAALETAIGGINEKVKLGLMSTAEGTDAIASAKDKAGNALAELIPQLDAIGSPAAKSFADSWRSAIGDMGDGISDLSRDLSKALTNDFDSAFASLVAGTATGKDAFQSFAQSVINDMAKIASQRFSAKFVAPLFDGLFSMLGFADGGVPAMAMGGAPVRFAAGGVPDLDSLLPPVRAFRNSVVDRPTFFAMGGKTGVMGEAGAEAILPLSRGADGKLGVASRGAGGGGVVVNVVNNSGAPAAKTERQENGVSIIDVMIGQVKGAIVDDFARGGEVSSAASRSFGLTRQGF